MKNTISFAFIALLFIACSKENSSDKLQTTSALNAAAIPNGVNIPLNDLGAGTFMGSTGGLYPGGTNEPSGQYAADLLATSQGIAPIDTFGNPSSAKLAKIAFLSMGGSTGGHNMKLLKLKTVGNPVNQSQTPANQRQ